MPLPNRLPTANFRRRRIRSAPQMLFELFRREQERVMDFQSLSLEYPAVEVKNLRKKFQKRVRGIKGNKKDQKTINAVDGISFNVRRGEVFGLLGPNSSGKTTTLKCIATLSKPDEGEISFYDLNVLEKPFLARRIMGFVAQSAGLDKILTGREHLEFFADLAHLDKKKKKRNIEQAIEILQLEDFIDRQASVYSGGVIRRLDLAICLLHEPAILILDEPTVGLDVESRTVIWEVLKTIRDRGAAILLTSHYLEEVDILSDRVAIMDSGIILAQGTPISLKNALGGDRITVRLNEFTELGDAEHACEVMRRRGLVKESIINRLRNNCLELVVDAENATVANEIIQALADAGYDKLFSFAQAKPSLDDVYLAATGKTLSDADATARETRDAKTLRKESMV